MRTRALLITAAALAASAPVAAQEPPSAAAVPVAGSGDPKLVFEREVFSYRGAGRRDPFRALTTASSGPLFEDLKLNVILHSPNPAESVVLVSDASRKQYRLRRGDSVGNATVVDIGQTRVVFAVVDFGIRRQEVLDLKAKEEGAGR